MPSVKFLVVSGLVTLVVMAIVFRSPLRGIVVGG